MSRLQKIIAVSTIAVVVSGLVSRLVPTIKQQKENSRKKTGKFQNGASLF